MGGREITVAKSKSLLIWDADKEEFHEKLTTEVKIDDYIPVTMKLAEPPIIIKYVDMSKYFPKDKYIHGSEFNKAVSMMKEAMGTNRIQIPRGWWEKHNGTSFITPYTKKASLTRVTSGRSNTENIKDRCVYPYHASRDTCRIPDKFELNYENGQFIGLFLADGHADIHSGQVVITKKDESVKAFVKTWFTKYDIKYKERTDKKLRGTTTTISGYSTLLVLFLNEFVGIGSKNKYVPDVAFIAPIEFVKGILAGYFSGDGHVKNSGISSGSVSRDLTEGIALLCNRLGIFCKISTTQQKSNNIGTINISPMHNISIRAQWARKFKENITLLVDYKNNEVQSISGTQEHCNYPYKNDVVLDRITEIIEIIPDSNSKLYDVTVPSTLNFAIRNGIHSYDTSETGYIQRRLVKAMEDNKIYYDQTVRNATGAIVQYIYGEDGIDGTKIENQYIPYIQMNLIQLDTAYHLRKEDPLDIHVTPEAMELVRKNPMWVDKADKYFEQIIDDRLFLIRHIFKGEDTNKLQYPIPFERIIKNSMRRMNLVTKKSEIKSNEIDAILPTDLTPEYVFDTIESLSDRLRIVHKDQGVKFLQILLRCYLCPKTLIFEYHMPLTVFDYVIAEIEKAFIKAIAHAGEMVGIVAAQSIGELSTQQSVTGDTIVNIIHTVNNKDILYVGEIGAFIDKLMANSKKVHTMAHGGEVLNLPLKESYTIVSLTNEEKLKWARISQVSRHPANGNLIKVTTRSGRTVTATLSHSFLMRNCYGIFAIKGALLKVGDRIPVAKTIPKNNNYIDDSFNDYKFSVNATDDIIPNIHEIAVTMKSLVNKDNYTRTDLQEIIQTAKNKTDNRMLIKLLQQGIDGDVIYDEIISIEKLDDPKTYVYDFTVPGTESFMVNYGIMVHNTLDSFHSSGTAAAVKATSGVPRLKELLSVSKNIKTPTLIIYMKEDIGTVVDPIKTDTDSIDIRVQESKDRSMKIMKQIEITYLADILDNTEIYWDPPGNTGLESGLAEDNHILDIYRAFSTIECQKVRSQSPWVLRMKLNKVKMYRIGITMLDIYTKMNTMYNQSIDCIFSDDNDTELIFRIRLTKDILKDIDPDDAIAALKAMEYNLTHNVLLKGVKGIKKVSMREKKRKQYNEDLDKFEQISEWVLDTDGTNLVDILANQNIDNRRTRSNDIYEILQVLGIEAARNALYQEFMEVTGEDEINYRHMSLLLDTMTNRGTLMSVDRHGINRGDVGPLAKCSFEETTDMLINASIFSELDNINGVSANIMLGQLPPCGTGDHEILIDETKYMALLKERGAKKMKLDVPSTIVIDMPTLYDEKKTCTVDNIASKYKIPRKTKKKMPESNVTFV